MLNFAYYLANAQQNADAKIVLSGLASGASDPEIRDNAKGLLKRILDFEHQLKSARRSWSAPPRGRGCSNSTCARSRAANRSSRACCGPSSAGKDRSGWSSNTTARHRSVQAASFDSIEFITYRESQGGRIECGKRPDGDRVLVTYRPGLQGDSVGELVAVSSSR